MPKCSVRGVRARCEQCEQCERCVRCVRCVRCAAGHLSQGGGRAESAEEISYGALPDSPGMVACVCNPRTWEVEAGRSGVQGYTAGQRPLDCLSQEAFFP